MKVKSITYPTAFDNGVDVVDDNIDVFVELEDGRIYCVVVSTYKNIATQIEKSNTGMIGKTYTGLYPHLNSEKDRIEMKISEYMEVLKD